MSISLNYFNKYCKILAKGLSKQQALDKDPKATQINLTGNLAREGNSNTTVFSLLKKQKKPF